jgi:hypothetical protein
MEGSIGGAAAPFYHAVFAVITPKNTAKTAYQAKTA